MAYFIQFVNNETLVVIYPVFSKEAVEKYVEKKPIYKKDKISGGDLSRCMYLLWRNAHAGKL